MGLITQAVMVRAIHDVNNMSQAQKLRLADDIYEHQPNLLASILVLPNMGVGALQLEVALHVLLVVFQAMKQSDHVWPVITEELQGKCLQRLIARMRFNEGLPAELGEQVVQRFCDEYAERHLLAFAFGQLSDHDLLGMRTDAEKFLLLAVLNLVECTAFVGTLNSAG